MMMMSEKYSVIQPLRLLSEVIGSTQLIYRVIERFSGDVEEKVLGRELHDFVDIVRECYKGDVGVINEPNCRIDGINEIEEWYENFKVSHTTSSKNLLLLRKGEDGEFLCIHISELESPYESAPKAILVIKRRNQLFSIDEIISLRAGGRIFTTYCGRLYSNAAISLETKLRSIIEPKLPPTEWLVKFAVYTSPETSICCDLNGTIIAKSRSANEMFDNVEDTGHRLGWLATLFHPDDLKTAVGQFTQVFASKNHHSFSARLFDKSGAIKNFYISLKPIEQEGNAFIWLVEIVDRNLVNSGSPIPRIMFAEMAHEIRTPLSCIIGTSSLLDFTNLSSEQRELIHTIKTCGQQLFNLINGILDITRMDYSKMLLEYNNVILERVIYEATEIVYSEAALKHLAMIVDIDDNCPDRIIVDEQRLRQIIGTLYL